MSENIQFITGVEVGVGLINYQNTDLFVCL